MRTCLFVPIIALAGCTVGPDYAPPASTAAPEWVEPVVKAPVDLAWWNSFNDPLLSSLVERAIANAPEARIASARLAEARANRDAAYGGRFPQVNAIGSITENVLSENGQLPVANIPGFERDFSLFDLGFDASWEIDLWGRQRREHEGAQARADAALEARRETQLRLAAEVARSYVDLRAAQQEAGLQERISQSASAQAGLVAQLHQAGDASRIDAEHARAAAANAARQPPLARAKAKTAMYRIAALLGLAPEELAPELEPPAPLPAPPFAIGAGLRSELLERRPDVRRAERELAAATAGIGIAKADLFPRFSLLGSLGTQARNTGDLTSSDSLRLNVGPHFSWPIFSAGRIRAQVRAADARVLGAAAAWEGAVAGALADSEAAINRHANAQIAYNHALDSLDSQRRVNALARKRYDAGEDSRSQWLAAEIELAQAELGMLQAQSMSLDAAIALNKALGGGWSDAD
ncbi:MAG: efflux transporter outer membrane subunit [Alphaproteobacteria bacterium]|nr:MAG: efflux transporter outer membrane subunit [Alphaproteobacteria bacterium]